MIVRKGTAEDLAGVGSLWLSLIDEVFPGRNPDIHYWVNFTSDLLANCPEYSLFVAEEGGKIIGFTDFIIQYDPTFSKKILNSFQTYVLPPFRNTGATKALWSEVVSGAKANDCPTIFFSTAPKLYEYWTHLAGAELSEVSMVIDPYSLKEV